jgi:hypothetical protein
LFKPTKNQQIPSPISVTARKRSEAAGGLNYPGITHFPIRRQDLFVGAALVITSKANDAFTARGKMDNGET